MPERRKGEIAKDRRKEKERTGLTRVYRRSCFRCKYVHYLLGSNGSTYNPFGISHSFEICDNQIRARETVGLLISIRVRIIAARTRNCYLVM